MTKNLIANLDSNSWSYTVLTAIPVVSDVVFHLKYESLASDVASRVLEMQKQKAALSAPKLRELLTDIDQLQKAPQRIKLLAGIHWIGGASLWLVSPVAATISILYGGIHGFLAARKEEQNSVENHWKAIIYHYRTYANGNQLLGLSSIAKEIVPTLYPVIY